MSALVERLIAARDVAKRQMSKAEYGGFDFYAARELVDILASAANVISGYEPRVTQLERWWYAVPEEQRFAIMSDDAWKRHEAAGQS